MIKVVPQPEPTGFNKKVREPGGEFLATWRPGRKFRNYWKRVNKDLHEAYQGICAYTCMYMVSPGSVDHFLPKTRHPNLAYEWSNYRLCTPRVNQKKSNRTDIIDPFTVQPRSFVIDFPSCLIKASTYLVPTIAQQVETTIHALRLNQDDALVQDRCDVMIMFANGDVGMQFLITRYPFIAFEIQQQNLNQTSVQALFKPRTLSI